MAGNASLAFSSLSVHHCGTMYIVITAVRAIFLLPLSIIFLYLGFQKWRQQRSFQTTSNSDLFAYNQAAMEFIWVLGWFCILSTFYVNVESLALLGSCLCYPAFYGEISFQTLTCVERYLAVVHPVIYMGLRSTRGVRMRNIINGCIWVLCFVLTMIHVFVTDNSIELFCLLAVSMIVSAFCTVSVLCVLIRPGPGDGGRDKERVDQSKQRAFHTITAISITLFFWFVGLIVAFALKDSKLLDVDVSCFVIMFFSLLNLPCCMLLPLLCLHRAGKLTFRCCCRE